MRAISKPPRRPAKVRRCKPQKATDSAKNDGRQRAGQDVNAIIERLQELTARKDRNRLQLIRDYVELGQELQKLKEVAGHGNWAQYRDRAGFDESKAVRLMKLAKSWLGQEILANGQDLMRLPTDIKKLVALVKLSRDQVQELIAQYDLDELTRPQVRDAVESLQPSSQDAAKVQSAARAAASGLADTTVDEPASACASEPLSASTSETESESARADNREAGRLHQRDADDGATAATRFIKCCDKLVEMGRSVLADMEAHPAQQLPAQIRRAVADTVAMLNDIAERIGSAEQMKTTGRRHDRRTAARRLKP